jgi:WD40 repeat protein
VLIAGGTGNHGTFAASAELYDPRSGKFSRTGSMAVGRAFDTATLLSDGTVLFAGGEGAANDTYTTLRSAELYAPATGKFSPTGSMSAARDYGSATRLADGRVLMAGGSEDASAELYDPATRTFSATGSMKAVRLGPTATVLLDGRVLITGGSGDASAELYDPTNDTFSPTTGSMNAVRFSHTATRLPDGRVLIAGGNPLALAMLMPSFASAELYQP